jgi:hypothetical protein
MLFTFPRRSHSWIEKSHLMPKSIFLPTLSLPPFLIFPHHLVHPVAQSKIPILSLYYPLILNKHSQFSKSKRINASKPVFANVGSISHYSLLELSASVLQQRQGFMRTQTYRCPHRSSLSLWSMVSDISSRRRLVRGLSALQK